MYCIKEVNDISSTKGIPKRWIQERMQRKRRWENEYILQTKGALLTITLKKYVNNGKNGEGCRKIPSNKEVRWFSNKM